mmetsp:Transcript_8434/g.16387  ORF Transcript_8434/g.16387 Transcript_8434/m.16387 type:complete len:240 (+) Transcript_8434:2084-2803(+)
MGSSRNSCTVSPMGVVVSNRSCSDPPEGVHAHVDSVDVVHHSIHVVVKPGLPEQFGLIPPHGVPQVRVGEVNTCVNDSDKNLRRIRSIQEGRPAGPCLRCVYVGIRRLIQVPLFAKERVVHHGSPEGFCVVAQTVLFLWFWSGFVFSSVLYERIKRNNGVLFNELHIVVFAQRCKEGFLAFLVSHLNNVHVDLLQMHNFVYLAHNIGVRVLQCSREFAFLSPQTRQDVAKRSHRCCTDF